MKNIFSIFPRGVRWTILIVTEILFNGISFAQTNTFPHTGSVGIGTTTPNVSSALEIVSTTQGVLIPRMNKAARDAILSPVPGLLIYQTNSTPGFYYYDGGWSAVAPKSANKSLGNLTAPTAVNVELLPGTDNLTNLGTVSYSWKDIYLDGKLYLDGTVFIDNSGYSNAWIGNTGNTTNTGSYNTALGNQTLYSNTTGNSNAASGFQALYSNTTGNNNTATGYKALYSNISNSFNTATGIQSLYHNTADFNSATGYSSLYSNSTGTFNVADGYYSLFGNSTGSGNTAMGTSSGSHNDANTYCTFLGYDADQTVFTDFTNATALGNISRITASDQARIGNSSVTSIGGYAGWTTLPSDSRFKRNIKEDVPGLEFINKLKPITYHVDVTGLRKFLGEDVTGKEGKEISPVMSAEQKSLIDRGVKEKEQIIYTGFIAQDVEKAAKEIGYDFSGVDAPKNENDLYGLRYAEFVVPLVKAVQELSEKNDQLTMSNERLITQNGELNECISKLESQFNLQSTTSDGTAKILIGNETVGALLGQNIPNPFDNSTLIPFRIPKDCKDAAIVIAEPATGKVVRVVPVSCGETQLTLEAGTLASGSYVYSLYVDGNLIGTRQMALAK